MLNIGGRQDIDMTPKHRQLLIRKCQLISFRRFLSLEGNGDAVQEFIGMNAWELREYMESKWMPGMNWGNYKEEWVVDHIVGLKYFDLQNLNERFLCWNYNNLKPTYLWDNHAKGYCVEITEKELSGLTQNIWVQRLRAHISDKVEMFERYY